MEPMRIVTRMHDTTLYSYVYSTLRAPRGSIEAARV